MYRLLAINPGSTSTKIGVFENEDAIFIEKVNHSTEEINMFKRVSDQFEFRLKNILEILRNRNFDLKTLDAIVARGGLLKPLESGTYNINALMISHLKNGNYGHHASNLGGIIAKELSLKLNGLPCFIVDPVVVDEMEDCARVSGLLDIERRSIFHALNQKAVAKRYAKENNIPYDKLNLIVAHMGGGISVGVHRLGRVVDVNNALDGEGPFSPERSGGLPTGDLVRLCFSGKYQEDEIIKKLSGKGGMVSYLNTNDLISVMERVKLNDKKYKRIYEAFIYQIGKEIGKCAAALKGNVDAIILTGGIAYSNEVVEGIKDMVRFISKVVVYPGEDEMLALTQGALRVLNGEEKTKEYI